jgi:hypothetical protein
MRWRGGNLLTQQVARLLLEIAQALDDQLARSTTVLEL